MTASELERRLDVLGARQRRCEERLALLEDKMTLVRVVSPRKPWWQWRLALTEDEWRTVGIAFLALIYLVEPKTRKQAK